MARKIPSAGAAAINLNPVRLADVDDLIDEEDLLADTSGMLAPPSLTARTAGADCGGRKPCDDCTCGRAEREGEEKKERDRDRGQKSSCGNCAKGDAFRCAGCPYLGLPALKEGKGECLGTGNVERGGVIFVSHLSHNNQAQGGTR